MRALLGTVAGEPGLRLPTGQVPRSRAWTPGRGFCEVFAEHARWYRRPAGQHPAG
ncbi:hypothetical protein ABZ419_20470 [Streptomyces cinnamoneus]|uniref:hypothetical protein n=1 Tax=Streptomyces cinnamoneus TaxID=53446 RepID=UPI0033E657E5